MSAEATDRLKHVYEQHEEARRMLTAILAAWSVDSRHVIPPSLIDEAQVFLRRDTAIR